MTEILNCSFDEVNSEKIRNLLDNKTKTNIEEILKIEEKKNIMLFKKRLEINKDKFKQNKNELIAICLAQL
ncbi:hypothetical protein IJR75_00075 [bacterium]|nr:hypothetical protein [bacterium]